SHAARGDIVHRQHGGVSHQREPDGKVSPQGLVELIIQPGGGAAPAARRRATRTSQGCCAHTDRVPGRKGDQLEPVAQVQVPGDDGPHRVRRRRPRQHDETGTDARPVDDPDADPAVDGGLSWAAERWTVGKTESRVTPARASAIRPRSNLPTCEPFTVASPRNRIARTAPPTPTRRGGARTP